MSLDHSLPVQGHLFDIPTDFHNDPTVHASPDHTICLWDVGGGIPCGACISVLDLSKHVRMHGVKGPGDLEIQCTWDGCARSPMKRESIVRHIEEVHVQVKYRCSQCWASFSRKHTLRSHIFKAHSHIS
ncbi:uncharacterized protein F5891DRAFT_681149 [Suillus fuscotomentosus]|uniref:C2H2-type domain-containing protein n=1 Tax=Suillus fuscotomentosus TaxID=1912939 RepID=A0AAD4DRL0_9AGAM|nr:uncharacterized protein F5891DRAFT_87015 [Suillus fuscotomentosus]XP_041230831.1 uncharacterized protein F5891DRAFT_681149 [Suillus fuscotomentosus]KAG1891775.1 hypothetical protein F5891DRAFT_87015 [Suillus fuscotomentosus]KAG1905256.1 hypothetical protein F5891DRAFT_681149 [Suillus fuscotomentosus]